LKTTQIVHITFRPKKNLKKRRTCLYSALDLPALLYGSENWSIKASDARRITAAEMKYMRINSRINLDRL
jgi:hypothetical protein